MGTGYSWMLRDSACIKYFRLDSTYVISMPIGEDNEPETQVFIFKIFTKGECDLYFIYKRPWEKSKATDKGKKYKVIVE